MSTERLREQRLAAWSREYDAHPIELTHSVGDVFELAAPTERPRLADMPVLMTLDDASGVLGLRPPVGFRLVAVGPLPSEGDARRRPRMLGSGTW